MSNEWQPSNLAPTLEAMRRLAGKPGGVFSGQNQHKEQSMYERKAGSGAIFRNNKKERDEQPDYTGSIALPDGTEHWISGWLKEGRQGKYLSLSIGKEKN